MIVFFLTVWARAAEVVWVGDVDPGQAEQVAATSGAQQGPLTPGAFLSAPTAIGPADDESYNQLTKTLERVRGLEDRLDGELIIMHDLDAAVGGISIVRNERDRDRVFAALAYEGFAVDRFFADDLPTDDRAIPYRRRVDGKDMVAAWVDAAAIAPEREVTPYEIAQAPHRATFRAVQNHVGGVARAVLDVRKLPEGVSLYLDGAPALIGSDQTVRVSPGRHWLHAVRRDVVEARWVVDVEPGVTEALAWPEAWASWNFVVAGLESGLTATPSEIREVVEAWGGEIWVARTAPKTPLVWRITTTTIAPVTTLERAKKPAPDAPASASSITLSAGGGWFYSADFYLQDYVALDPPDAATVNAGSLALGALWHQAIGDFRVGAGADLLTTLGAHHQAFYGGDASTPLRPHLFATGGHRYLGLTAGFLFPFDVALGLRGTIPIADHVSLSARGLVGVASTLDRIVDFPVPQRAAWVTVDWTP